MWREVWFACVNGLLTSSDNTVADFLRHKRDLASRLRKTTNVALPFHVSQYEPFDLSFNFASFDEAVFAGEFMNKSTVRSEL